MYSLNKIIQFHYFLVSLEKSLRALLPHSAIEIEFAHKDLPDKAHYDVL